MPISHVSKILVGDVVIACNILLFLLTKLHQCEVLRFSHDPQSYSYGFLSILYTADIYQLCLPIQIYSLEKVRRIKVLSLPLSSNTYVDINFPPFDFTLTCLI